MPTISELNEKNGDIYVHSTSSLKAFASSEIPMRDGGSGALTITRGPTLKILWERQTGPSAPIDRHDAQACASMQL